MSRIEQESFWYKYAENETKLTIVDVLSYIVDYIRNKY